jgi:hypothetical protein
VRAQEFVNEKWSKKYKRSIDCSRPRGFSQRAHCQGRKVNEFAPSPDRDDDDVPDQLLVLANRWWNATDQQPQIESVLNSMGWSIAQVESEDDAVQLQHQDGTTYFISADDFDPDLHEEQLDELSFLGSQCTKDCSGHRAGYEWSAQRGNVTASSPYSPSFNMGAALRNAGK